MTLLLKRSPQQQADLDALLLRQQMPGSADFHKWLSPQQFGERFGVAEADMNKVIIWLQSQGFQVKGVLNNASMIRFETSAAGVRNSFRTQLLYWNDPNGKFISPSQEPQIPAALTAVISGIKASLQATFAPTTPRFTPSPTTPRNTPGTIPARRLSDPSQTTSIKAAISPRLRRISTRSITSTPYTPAATWAAAQPSALSSRPTWITVRSIQTGNATGGNVATFRSNFGVPSSLSMKVMHGAGAVTCSDPGVVAGVEPEAALDVEWSNGRRPGREDPLHVL